MLGGGGIAVQQQALIWASIIGYLVWGDLPTMPMIIGAVIVPLTRLDLPRHEAFRRGPPRPAATRTLSAG